MNRNRKAQPVHETVHRSILVVGVLAFAIASRAFAQDTDTTYYYSGEQRVDLSVATDQLGVLLRADADPAEFRNSMESQSTRPVTTEQFPGGFLVITLAELGATGRLDMSRQMADSGAVARTGMIVRHDDVADPMILSRDFIARFKPGVSRQQIDTLNAENGVEVVLADPYVDNQFLLMVASGSELDALATANRYQESALTELAHPNFTRVVRERQFIPNDTLFGNQWHHNNTGQGGGTVDADIDSPQAWAITQGNANIVVAVTDSGFDAAHPDLANRLWTNPGEVVNGVDDDGNGRIDDVNGWDFTGCDVAAPPPGCGDAIVTGGNHGTSVAGLVAAQGNNNLGVSGACPNCRLMLIRNSGTDFGQGLAFNYVQAEGANISTNSWGYQIPLACGSNVCNAINAASGAGVSVFFAMANGNRNDCTGMFPDISSLASVFAVSASSNQDRKVTESAFGNCMELLAPTHRGYGPNLQWVPACGGAGPPGPGAAFTGTLNIATTDRVGNAGYNNANPSFCYNDATRCTVEAAQRDYTLCFGGTSAATPTTAGIAGLALSADATLTRVQLQRLLQDTADKIQDSVGSYSTQTGFSTPAGGNASHGWGRANSFEAVRVVAPAAAGAPGGLGGRDVFIRDNRLDWGNTEQPSNVLQEPVRGFIPHWESVDVKVDHPPYEAAPVTNADFEAFTDEHPESGEVNKVYVRVRNRGPRTAASTTVKLHWAFAGAGLPALPGDFWPQFPADSADTTQWHPLGVRNVTNLAYSGASAAGCPGRATPPCGGLNDAAQIVGFDFTGPPVDLTQPHPRHYCLLAILDSPQDPVSAASQASQIVDWITPRDNNVTHRNLVLQDSSRSSRFRFYLNNPTNQRLISLLEVRRPEGWKLQFEGVDPGGRFEMDPGEQILVTMDVAPSNPGGTGEIQLIQSFPGAAQPFQGGLTLDYANRPELIEEDERQPAWSFHLGISDPQGIIGPFLDEGIAATLDYTFPINPRWSWDARLGYTTFDLRFGGGEVDVWDLSANLKAHFPTSGSWWAFVNGGPGVYYLDSSDVEGGYNVGIGLGFQVRPRVAFEVTFNRHETLTASPDIEFDKLQLGVLWNR